MDPKTTKRLNEFYYGIVAFGRVSYKWFGVIDFAELAASAINLMVKRCELYSWDRDEAYRFMVNSFNRDIGGQMTMGDISTVITHMKGITTINSKQVSSQRKLRCFKIAQKTVEPLNGIKNQVSYDYFYVIIQT